MEKRSIGQRSALDSVGYDSNARRRCELHTRQSPATTCRSASGETCRRNGGNTPEPDGATTQTVRPQPTPPADAPALIADQSGKAVLKQITPSIIESVRDPYNGIRIASTGMGRE
jgi:hypothetical protein